MFNVYRHYFKMQTHPSPPVDPTTQKKNDSLKASESTPLKIISEVETQSESRIEQTPASSPPTPEQVKALESPLQNIIKTFFKIFGEDQITTKTKNPILGAVGGSLAGGVTEVPSYVTLEQQRQQVYDKIDMQIKTIGEKSQENIAKFSTFNEKNIQLLQGVCEEISEGLIKTLESTGKSPQTPTSSWQFSFDAVSKKSADGYLKPSFEAGFSIEFETILHKKGMSTTQIGELKQKVQHNDQLVHQYIKNVEASSAQIPLNLAQEIASSHDKILKSLSADKINQTTDESLFNHAKEVGIQVVAATGEIATFVATRAILAPLGISLGTTMMPIVVAATVATAIETALHGKERTLKVENQTVVIDTKKEGSKRFDNNLASAAALQVAGNTGIGSKIMVAFLTEMLAGKINPTASTAEDMEKLAGQLIKNAWTPSANELEIMKDESKYHKELLQEAFEKVVDQLGLDKESKIQALALISTTLSTYESDFKQNMDEFSSNFTSETKEAEKLEEEAFLSDEIKQNIRSIVISSFFVYMFQAASNSSSGESSPRAAATADVPAIPTETEVTVENEKIYTESAFSNKNENAERKEIQTDKMKTFSPSSTKPTELLAKEIGQSFTDEALEILTAKSETSTVEMSQSKALGPLINEMKKMGMRLEQEKGIKALYDQYIALASNNQAPEELDKEQKALLKELKHNRNVLLKGVRVSPEKLLKLSSKLNSKLQELAELAPSDALESFSEIEKLRTITRDYLGEEFLNNLIGEKSILKQNEVEIMKSLKEQIFDKVSDSLERAPKQPSQLSATQFKDISKTYNFLKDELLALRSNIENYEFLSSENKNELNQQLELGYNSLNAEQQLINNEFKNMQADEREISEKRNQQLSSKALRERILNTNIADYGERGKPKQLKKKALPLDIREIGTGKPKPPPLDKVIKKSPKKR